MKHSPDQYIDFTVSVLLRPGMYTLNGTLGEAIAFLEGFYSGQARHMPGHFRMQEAIEWREFETWLSEQLNTTSAHAAFREIEKSQPSQAVAFLLDYYQEFHQNHLSPTDSLP